MEDTSKLRSVSDREIFYYRQRFTNRLFQRLTAFFEEEAKTRGITKKDIAHALRRDPSQISRWLRYPSNITTDTISDLLLRLGAEIDPVITRFTGKGEPNQMHPLIDAIVRKDQELEISIKESPKDVRRVGLVVSTSASSTNGSTTLHLEDVGH
jgi:hypothetical protein